MIFNVKGRTPKFLIFNKERAIYFTGYYNYFQPGNIFCMEYFLFLLMKRNVVDKFGMEVAVTILAARPSPLSVLICHSF